MADTLRLACVIVKNGGPEPAEWMARPPDWIRIPAMPVTTGGVPADAALDALNGSLLEASRTGADAPEVQPRAASSGELAKHSVFVSQTATDRTDAEAPDSARERGAPETEASVDPARAVPVIDDAGHPVASPDGAPMLRPISLDPHTFVKSDTEYDERYTLLPKRNVENTDIGIRICKNLAFAADMPADENC